MPTRVDNINGSELASPWKEFLSDLDGMLSEPVQLHCIGGFVFSCFYGLYRPTRDVDYFTAIPVNLPLTEMAGEGSPLHRKHKVCLHSAAVTSLPEHYESRLQEMICGNFKHLRLFVPDPYDCILSKLQRNDMKDRDDVEYLFRSKKLDTKILKERYEKEFRYQLTGSPEWHDGTLALWIEIFEASAI